MNSEFQQLAEKVTLLAQLATSLRDENLELRRKLQSLTDDSAHKLQTLTQESAQKLQALTEENSARIQALTEENATRVQTLTQESTARIAALTAENTVLGQRVDEAWQRVSAVLESLPAAPEPEAPAETTEEAA